MMSMTRSLRLAATLALTSLALGCGSSDGGPTGGSKLGSLAVTLAGLPPSAAANVSLTGANGFSVAVTATGTIADLQPGTYILTAGDVVADEDRFAPAAVSQSISITAGARASATVTWNITTGSVRVAATGLPTGAAPAAMLSGPNGYSRAISSATRIGGLVPGAYTVTPAPVTAQGHTWSSTTPPVTVQVVASPTPQDASLTWQLATGAIAVQLDGIPSGATATASISGPNAYARTVASGETVTNLAPGTYTVTASAIQSGADRFLPAAPAQVVVAPSLEPMVASLSYALASGRLAIDVSGLPQGAAAQVRITGPGNYTRTIIASETLTGLAPGTYTITPNDLSLSGVTWGVPGGPQQVNVTASSVAVQATVTYAITRGSLSVVINGLPQSIPAGVTVTGPENYSQVVATTTILTALKPGVYTVTAAQTLAGVHVYGTTTPTQQVTIGANATPSQATVAYALASGMVSLTVNGLPLNVDAPMTLTGPGGYTRSLTGSTLITGLTPGAYTLIASEAQSGNSFWAPNPASQVITVPASTTALQASVTYATANGTLVVTINGLPGGTNAAVTMTGPGNFSQVLTQSTTLNGLRAGVYTLASAAVTVGPTTYTVTPASQLASVGGGVTSSITLTYVGSGGPPPPPQTLNLTIDGMHIQQVVQTYAGTVPLVAGKDGLLRVFAKANTSNSASAAVRVRIYNGPTLQSTVTIAAPTSSVPTSISQSPLTSSWNTLIPGSLMQPGLKILADVDPTNGVTESSDSDNTFPVSGVAASMDVRTLPSFDIRFVPVHQSINSTTGGVNAGNMNSYLADALAVFPIGTVSVDVRATYTTTAPALQADDNNGAWGQVLSELSALRTADGSTRYYAGIAKVNYSSGIAGLGYVPGKATLSWDYLPSASGVVAHELGHNFGRFHAPCGGAGNPDPSYPYAGGAIGQYGLALATSTLKAPTLSDLMGYCSTNWISDYTYNAVLSYRTTNGAIANARVTGLNPNPRRGLLVWGRVHRGQLILEPAFEVTAAPSLPERPGPFRLQAFGPLGESLIDLAFDGEVPGDSPDATARHFSFVIPMDMLGGIDPERLRFSRGTQAAERRTARGVATRTAPAVVREGGRVRVQGDPTIQGLMVRDARTGDILSFARGADAVVTTAGAEVDVIESDGVKSQARRVRVAPERR